MQKQRYFTLLLALNLGVFCLMLLAQVPQLLSFIKQTHLRTPPLIFAELAFNCLAHLLLYSGLSFLSAVNVISLLHYQKTLTDYRAFCFTVYYWCLTLLALVCGNQVYFPLSHYALLSSSLLPNAIAYGLFVLLGLCFGLNCLLSLYLFLKRYTLVGGSLMLLCLSVILLDINTTLPITPPINPKPNVIIIGFDSLQLDKLTTATMPWLSKFLTDTQRFTNTTTPLARTYPSWMSILSGRYPNHHGAIFNLMPFNQVNVDHNLAKQLQASGYQTIYATDEKRFSAIDEAHGFDKVLGPKLGVNDFILGSSNDFPLSNLIINTPLGRTLFPFNHANRASAMHYYPGVFTKDIINALPHQNQPLFLAVHLTLPHWPYQFARSPEASPGESAASELAARIPAIMQAADNQFHQLFYQLTSLGYLNNALVVVLSDHGDTLNEIDSRIIDNRHYYGTRLKQIEALIKKLGNSSLNQSMGHGSDLLSPKQSNCLLAFQRYPKNWPATRHADLVSLIDIRATINDFLAQPATHSDGKSLYPLLQGHRLTSSKPRYFYSQSGFSPSLQLSINPNALPLSLSRIASQYYRIEPNNARLVMQTKQVARLKNYKQLAVRYKQWLLAMYPDGERYQPLLVNLNTHEWTDSLNSQFAKHSPAKVLQDKLISHFNIAAQRITQ